MEDIKINEICTICRKIITDYSQVNNCPTCECVMCSDCFDKLEKCNA